MPPSDAFSPVERSAVYRAIHERRDIRSYRPDPVPWDVMQRLLDAAHHAGSVGFMQPWNFLLIDDQAVRRKIYDHFRAVNERAAQTYDGDRQDQYRSLKLQGILDAPLNLLVTCDTRRGGPHVLGRATIRETDVYSTCLAVQNFWLAARAEGIGVGWMSLMEPEVVCSLLGIPAGVIPVAYLTVGFPVEFPDAPMLSSVGWRHRLPLEEVVFANHWGQPAASLEPSAEAPADGPTSRHAVQERLDGLTKPRGSLGKLEQVALRIAGVQGRPFPRAQEKWLLLLAGDHGVAAEGVSAYLPRATAQMMYQFAAGGGAVNTFARQNGIRLRLADLGVDHAFEGATAIQDAKVRRGTRNFCREPAMTPQECDQALSAGRNMVRAIPALDILAVGEMGIGNSTSAAAIACALTGAPPADVVGPGTGVGVDTRRRKIEVVAKALSLHAPRLGDPLEVLCCLGGYELAGLVGAIEAAAERRVPVLLDGFITAAAALVAVRRTPELGACLLAAHRSPEPGHAVILRELRLDPLLSLDMRLGEGSGAALAMGLVEAACRILAEMRTFEEVGLDAPLSPGAGD